ncbi:MAG: undecaprenyl/decaprenyl-phosphate alpha-N-acetylglucosaminyl 1-phosphate transferase, partial [Planctomycetaceae bacterium]|nr:undecaprenyl/decaprenyl-phosphate alpha-N-acetylglucosaminyl 1-phosphate transferase [Planctomycetaceae bacterium]
FRYAEKMIFILFTVFIFSLAVSFAACHLVKRIAPFIGLVDKPGERKIHSVPIPTGGGIGVWLGVLIPFAIGTIVMFMPQVLNGLLPDSVSVHISGIISRCGALWTFLALGSVLLLLGVLDDRFNLDWKLRLGVQLVVAIITVQQGWSLNFQTGIPYLTDCISVLWIVALINSFNMLDNMNGLSAGIAAICSSFLAAVMFLSPNPASLEPQFFVSGFLLVLTGSIAGFLIHNNPFRASMFLGDGGAYFIGFLLSASTLAATFSSGTEPQRIFTPLVILAVPLYDLCTVITIRLLNRKSIFTGDKNHFSHRLVKIGMSPTLAVLTIYLTTTICGLGSLLLYKTDFSGGCLIFGQVILLLLLIGTLEYIAKKEEQ